MAASPGSFSTSSGRFNKTYVAFCGQAPAELSQLGKVLLFHSVSGDGNSVRMSGREGSVVKPKHVKVLVDWCQAEPEKRTEHEVIVFHQEQAFIVPGEFLLDNSAVQPARAYEIASCQALGIRYGDCVQQSSFSIDRGKIGVDIVNIGASLQK